MLLMKNKHFTDEELGLYDDMLLQRPFSEILPIVELGICEVGKQKKRLLCCRVLAPTGGCAYLHYHPDGVTEAEMRQIMLNHDTKFAEDIERAARRYDRLRGHCRVPVG